MDQIVYPRKWTCRLEQCHSPTKELHIKNSQPTTLGALHYGEAKSLALAKECFYWPGMFTEVPKTVKNCKLCLAMQSSQPREPLTTEPATEPMSHIGSDIFKFRGKKYIVITDRYSS